MHSAAWAIAKPIADPKQAPLTAVALLSAHGGMSFGLTDICSWHGDWHSDERIFGYLLEPLLLSQPYQPFRKRRQQERSPHWRATAATPTTHPPATPAAATPPPAAAAVTAAPSWSSDEDIAASLL